MARAMGKGYLKFQVAFIAVTFGRLMVFQVAFLLSSYVVLLGAA